MSMARKIRCQVGSVTDHGDHVYTVALKPERPVPGFRPGQFLHLTLDDYDPSGFWPESRVFSIASSPQERGKLVISYSVKGVYTTRMEQELVTGKNVWVKLPYGDFVVDGARDVVLIAGGTGITAFQAFIGGLNSAHSQRVRLLYGARRRELLLGLELFEQKRTEVATFVPVYFSETDPCGALLSDPVIVPGLLRLDVLSDCDSLNLPVYYLAGPPVMIAAMRKELVRRGVLDVDIRVDAWE